MKFLSALLVWLIMAACIATGFAMAAHGKPWLLIGSAVAFLALFARFGCLTH
jgi:hypothetical protein